MTATGPLYPHFAEVDAFIDSLSPRAFQALSNGIGIGTPREARRVIVPEPIVSPRVEFVPPPPPRCVVPTPVPPPVAAPLFVREMDAPPPVADHVNTRVDEWVAAPIKARRPGRWLARSVDFGIVLIASVALIVGLAIVSAAPGASGLSGILGSGPARWIAAMPLWQILAGVACFHFLYTILFRLLAGVTLGEFLMSSGDRNALGDNGAIVRNH